MPPTRLCQACACKRRDDYDRRCFAATGVDMHSLYLLHESPDGVMQTNRSRRATFVILFVVECLPASFLGDGPWSLPLMSLGYTHVVD